MIPRDTSSEAHDIQLRVYRRMSSEERTELAIEMSEEARTTALDGIRRRNPQWDADECWLELLRLLWGDALFSRLEQRVRRRMGRT